MKTTLKIASVLTMMFISTSLYAQLPEEIQWKHLEKIYTPDSTQLVLKLNGKVLDGKYKIPFDEGGFALYTIKSGKITGDAFWYSTAGNVECKLRYKNGVRNGLKENYDRDGKVWLRQEFINGKQDGINEMYSGGQLSNKSEYKNNKKDGPQYSYSGDKVITETNYKDGLRDGLSKTYGLDGKVITEINYKADKQDGLTTMFAMGNKTMDFMFVDGKKHGIGHMYKPNGSVVFTNYFINGEKVSKDEYDKYRK
ncbi:toxin-antitoxin system YwqK family antitoxin [Pedobacter changchengzhani]|nr:toxin-antitoxin system YwqK family antitoxin [Pedobacter changchengzhani]